MKKIIFLLIILAPCCLQAQSTYTSNQGHYDVLTFAGGNSFGNEGITITTRIPSNESHSTTVYIKGYDKLTRTIGIQVSWFYIDDEFINMAASSTGGWTPIITLDNSSDFIQIHLNDFSDEQYLEVIAFADKKFDHNWFTDWEVGGSGGSGIEVNYVNRFGEVYAHNIYSDGLVNGERANFSNNLNVGESTNTSKLAVTYNATVGGRLGIGLTNPSVPLHTLGGVRFQGLAHSTDDKVLSTDANGNLKLVAKTPAYWQSHNNASTIVYNGVVGIGIVPTTLLNTTSNYKLVVGGTIGAAKVKVTQAGWADYVFAKGYKLQPLTEVEKFIHKNGHLPEVPTTREVADNGVDIGETQVILLKKIEELTLHLIEQNKQLEKQNSNIERQNSEIKSLRKQVNELKKK